MLGNILARSGLSRSKICLFEQFPRFRKFWVWRKRWQARALRRKRFLPHRGLRKRSSQNKCQEGLESHGSIQSSFDNFAALSQGTIPFPSQIVKIRSIEGTVISCFKPLGQ